MIERVTWLLICAVGISVTHEAKAGMPSLRELVCPVGGGQFTHTTTSSYSTFGQRPDGKPYGSWEFPLDLPVCPDNGLVMYRDFTPPEVARLEALVRSPEYKRLSTERTYYRAAWLMQGLGDKPDDVAWMVNQASWQADDDPVAKSRYQRDFIVRTRKLTAASAGDDLTLLGLHARAANAYRELGEFDAAAAYLEALPVSMLKGPASSTPAGCDDDCRQERVEQRTHWRTYFDTLAKAIARRDASSEPIDMIPEEAAASKCVAFIDTAQIEPLCNTPKLRKLAKRFRASR